MGTSLLRHPASFSATKCVTAFVMCTLLYFLNLIILGNRVFTKEGTIPKEVIPHGAVASIVTARSSLPYISCVHSCMAALYRYEPKSVHFDGSQPFNDMAYLQTDPSSPRNLTLMMIQNENVVVSDILGVGLGSAVTETAMHAITIISSEMIEEDILTLLLFTEVFREVYKARFSIVYINSSFSGNSCSFVSTLVKNLIRTVTSETTPGVYIWKYDQIKLKFEEVMEPMRGAEQHTIEESEPRKPICFTTSAFGHSIDQLDQIPDISHTDHSISQNVPSIFRFFVFTNQQLLESPGWEKVFYPKYSTTYPNYITASRYGKFLAWQVPELVTCRTIFYIDGGWLPAKTMEYWIGLSNTLSLSEVGLIQYTHKWSKGPFDELSAILKHRKDTRHHIREEKEWLINQPQFNERSAMVCNMAFGYDPTSTVFRELATTFWQHYYLSDKGSWRDQPSWNYMLHDKFKMKPLYFGDWPQDLPLWSFLNMTGRDINWLKKGKQGFNNHQYVPLSKRKRRTHVG